MRNIIKILSLSIRRKKVMLLLAVAASLLLCQLYNVGKGLVDFFGEKTICVGVIDHDRSVLSSDLENYLTQSLGMEIVHESYDELSTRLLNKDISVIIEIPQNMYAKTIAQEKETFVITSLDDYENIAFIEAYLNTYMRGIETIAQVAKKDENVFNEMLSNMETDPIQMESAIVSQREEEKARAGFSFALGFLTMMIGMLAVFVSLTILDDKIMQTYNRMRISKIKPIEYILGTALFGIITLSICAIGIYLYVGMGGVDVGIPLGISMIATGLMILFSVGFAIMIALLAKTTDTAVSVTIGFTSIACIVGGVYFPIDDAVKTIKNLSYFTPHYWFTNLISKYEDINVLNHMLILSLFVILIYLISAVVFAKRK